MGKLLLSLSLIGVGLVAGYILQILLLTYHTDADVTIVKIRKLLQKTGLLVFMPISFAGALWVVSFADLRIVFLPLIGLLALLLGGLCGLIAAKLMKMSGSATGTLYCCGSFTNIGSIGALVAYIFLGEQGFGLVTLYKMFEEICYYTIGFPVAKYFQGKSEKHSLGEQVSHVIQDPFVRAAVAAFIVGVALNISDIPRPFVIERLNQLLVPTGTFLLLVSIGLGMRFSSVHHYLRECLAVCAIKFLVVPTVVVGISFGLGFHTIDSGLPLKVVLIVSSMPVAFTALVAASIYDLDLDLANSCWLVSTGALIVTLPVLSLILNSM